MDERCGVLVYLHYKLRGSCTPTLDINFKSCFLSKQLTIERFYIYLWPQHHVLIDRLHNGLSKTNLLHNSLRCLWKKQHISNLANVELTSSCTRKSNFIQRLMQIHGVDVLSIITKTDTFIVEEHKVVSKQIGHQVSPLINLDHTHNMAHTEHKT